MPTISRLLPSLAIPSYRISQKPTHITFSFIHELDLFSFLIPISFLASCCSKLANEADGIFCFFFQQQKTPYGWLLRQDQSGRPHRVLDLCFQYNFYGCVPFFFSRNDECVAVHLNHNNRSNDCCLQFTVFPIIVTSIIVYIGWTFLICSNENASCIFGRFYHWFAKNYYSTCIKHNNHQIIPAHFLYLIDREKKIAYIYAIPLAFRKWYQFRCQGFQFQPIESHHMRA